MKYLEKTVSLANRFDEDEFNSHVHLFNDLNVLNYIGRKNPQFTNHITSLYMKDFCCRELNLFITTLKSLIEHSTILKNLKVNVFSFSDLEKLDDAIQISIKENMAIKMVKSITSNKYKHLINQDVIQLFVELIAHDITHSDLQALLGHKLAAYKTPDMFVDAVEKVLADFSESSMCSIINRIQKEKINADIVYKNVERNVLILKINTYKASKALGSHHWCISYNENYFNQYVNGSKSASIEEVLFGKTSTHQYFVFDFNKNDKTQMIGITMRENKITASHYKDDSAISRSIVFNQFYYLIRIDNEILQKPIKSLLTPDDMNDRINNSSLKRNNKMEAAIKYLSDHDEYVWAHFDYVHNLHGLLNPVFAVRFLEFYAKKDQTEQDKIDFAKRFNTYWNVGDQSVLTKFEEQLESYISDC
jgi:hypothetical protein